MFFIQAFNNRWRFRQINRLDHSFFWINGTAKINFIEWNLLQVYEIHLVRLFLLLLNQFFQQFKKIGIMALTQWFFRTQLSVGCQVLLPCFSHFFTTGYESFQRKNSARYILEKSQEPTK